MTYEDRPRELELPTLEERRKRERGDMITLHKLVNKIDKIDKDDLLPARSQGLRGHGNKLRKGNCLREKMYSFPQKCVDM